MLFSAHMPNEEPSARRKFALLFFFGASLQEAQGAIPF